MNVWRTALDELGYPVGPWLNEAKRAMRRGMPDDHRVEVPGHGPISLGWLRGHVFRITAAKLWPMSPTRLTIRRTGPRSSGSPREPTICSSRRPFFIATGRSPMRRGT